MRRSPIAQVEMTSSRPQNAGSGWKSAVDHLVVNDLEQQLTELEAAATTLGVAASTLRANVLGHEQGVVLAVGRWPDATTQLSDLTADMHEAAETIDDVRRDVQESLGLALVTDEGVAILGSPGDLRAEILADLLAIVDDDQSSDADLLYVAKEFLDIAKDGQMDGGARAIAERLTDAVDARLRAATGDMTAEFPPDGHPEE